MPAYDYIELNRRKTLLWGFGCADLIVAVRPSVSVRNTVSVESLCDMGRTRRGNWRSKGTSASCGAKIADWAQHGGVT